MQSFSNFGHFPWSVFSAFGSFLPSVVFYLPSFSTFSHSMFGHSTFGHFLPSAHSTFGLTTFSHSTFSHSTFGHSFALLKHIFIKPPRLELHKLCTWPWDIEYSRLCCVIWCSWSNAPWQSKYIIGKNHGRHMESPWHQ
jgi:hypothetical protein